MFQFLASCSDDCTLRIWHTETWKLVKTVSDVFVSTQSFFRRPSWAPDGSTLIVPGAEKVEKNGG